MAPFFGKKRSDALPEFLSITWDQINRWWEYWLLWKFSDRRIESFILMSNWTGAIPKSMLDTFAELDNFYSRMEAQSMKDDKK